MEQIHYIGLFNNQHLFYLNNKTHLSFISESNEEIYQYPLKSSIEIKANVYFLNRVYFMAQTMEDKAIKVFVIDLVTKQGFDIVLSETEIKETSKYMNTNASFVYEENMITLIGGINQQNKISSTIVTFDLSSYTLSKQKYQEFSFYPRYRHGSASYNGIIYVIGGFTKIPESEDGIAEDVQFIKYKNNSLNKFSTAKIEGEKPILMIDPTMMIVNEKYVVAFSVYKYPKIWIMETSNSIGKNYVFKTTSMTHLLSCNFDIDTNKESKSIAYSVISNEDKAIKVNAMVLQ